MARPANQAGTCPSGWPGWSLWQLQQHHRRRLPGCLGRPHGSVCAADGVALPHGLQDLAPKECRLAGS
eukprot:3520141-Amphidinium_carterae.1